MYTQYCIVGNDVSMRFMSFLLSAYSTKQLFLNNPRISFCLDAAYWNNWAFVSLFVYLSIGKQISNKDTIWTCSRCFLCYLGPGSFAVEGADTKNTGIKNANSTCTRGVCAEISYARGAGGISTLKGLGIHVQLSWILEIKWYNITMETGVRVGWLLLGLN